MLSYVPSVNTSAANTQIQACYDLKAFQHPFETNVFLQPAVVVPVIKLPHRHLLQHTKLSPITRHGPH